MIRHLLILGMPFANWKIMDKKLSALGYLPLTEEHTLTGWTGCWYVYWNSMRNAVRGKNRRNALSGFIKHALSWIGILQRRKKIILDLCFLKH